MKILYVNAAFRAGSRTARLAEAYLARCSGEVTRVDLGTAGLQPLDSRSLEIYSESVGRDQFADPMFDCAKQFAQADEIVIAAPFWNYSVPAALHTYLELVCTQGITFGLTPDGSYYSKCRAGQLTYITTAGGYLPPEDHAFGYIRTLAESFWHIPKIRCIQVDGLDLAGTDPEAKLAEAIAQLQ